MNGDIFEKQLPKRFYFRSFLLSASFFAVSTPPPVKNCMKRKICQDIGRVVLWPYLICISKREMFLKTTKKDQANSDYQIGQRPE